MQRRNERRMYKVVSIRPVPSSKALPHTGTCRLESVDIFYAAGRGSMKLSYCLKDLFPSRLYLGCPCGYHILHTLGRATFSFRSMMPA